MKKELSSAVIQYYCTCMLLPYNSATTTVGNQDIIPSMHQSTPGYNKTMTLIDIFRYRIQKRQKAILLADSLKRDERRRNSTSIQFVESS